MLKNNLYLKENKPRGLAKSLYLIMGIIAVSFMILMATIINAQDSGTLTVTQKGTSVTYKVVAPSGHKIDVGDSSDSWGVGYVDKMSDCDGDNEFAVTKKGAAINISPRKPREYSETVTNVNADDHGDNYLCVLALYVSGTTEDPEYSEEYLVSDSKIDLSPPTVKSVVNSRDGDKLVLTVTFDDNDKVEVVNKEENAGDKMLMVEWDGIKFKASLNDEADEGDVRSNFSNTLVFEHMIVYNDGYKELEEEPLTDTTESTFDSFDFKDSYGNSISGLLGAMNAELDLSDVTIDNTPSVNLGFEQSGDKTMLSVSVSPATFDNDTNDSTAEVSTVGTWTYRMATNKPSDACKEATDNTDEDDDDYLVDVSDANDVGNANNKWYCAHSTLVTDADDTDNWETREGKKIINTAWVQYVTDNSGPAVSVNSMDSKLVVRATDKSGISSINYINIASETAGCNAGWVFGSDLTLETTGNTSETSIAVTSDSDGQWICVRATDNRGNSSYKRAQLMMAEAEEMPAEEEEDDTPVDTADPQDQAEADDMNDEDMPADEEEADMSDDMVGVLPANWDSLSVLEKIAANPYQCLDTTRIRADNGQCLSGGSALANYDELVANPQTAAPVVTTPVETEEQEEFIGTEETTGQEVEFPGPEPEEEAETEEATPEPEAETEEAETSAEETDGEDGDNENNEGDEEDSSTVWIILAIVAVIVVVAIIIIASSSKKKNQI